jgi:protein phosphatase 2C family protein 2/3
MEDFAHVVEPFGASEGLYAAVFDGHGGDAVSRLASERLATILGEWWDRVPSDAALRSAFLAFDGEVAGEGAGSAAVVVVLENEMLLVANAGDSHAIVVSDSDQDVLTQEHRLENMEEYERVVAAGAWIRGPYMCLPNGKAVMTTRSLGEPQFKRIGQLAEPAVASRTIGADDRWLVLGSDGVWDALAADEVAELVRSQTTADAAADLVMSKALAVGDDNVSTIVVKL